MLDYIACIFVRLLNIIFFFIPISISLWFGRRLGTLVFIFNKKRRLVAYSNLKAAFANEKSPAELRKITKRVYQNMVQTFVEILNLTKVSKSYTDRYVEVVNLYRIQEAAKSGKGTILLTAHFGDWELSSLTSAMFGFPILVLVREQKMQRLNELLNRLRESKGCTVVRKGMDVKNLIRALRDNRIVGILADQDAGRNGTFVNFFGRPTSTHSGAIEMALRTGSIILPNFIVRTHGPYHKLYLEEYIDVSGVKTDEAARAAVQQYMSLLESYVRKYPDQWLWLHKRWKSTPARTILVLSDGKAGHLNQSLAVAEALRKVRAQRGFAPEDTRIVVVEVRYRNGLSRAALTACAAFAGWRCHGCMRCMKACLATQAYDTLMKTYSDFVISCGSSIAPVNIFMAKENNAKNIVIMKPSSVSAKKFSLAIVPEHDHPKPAKNVVTTALAPNLINTGKLRQDGEKLRQYVKVAKKNVIGLLVGGDNAEFALTPTVMNMVIDEVLRFCEHHDAELLVTTSRRTGRDVEAVLKERLAGNRYCKLLVIANQKNSPEVMGGIIDTSTVLAVTGESISMVSEAISSGKRVVVFDLEKKQDRATKHERVMQQLQRKGYIALTNANALCEALEKSLGAPAQCAKLDDEARIASAVSRLI